MCLYLDVFKHNSDSFDPLKQKKGQRIKKNIKRADAKRKLWRRSEKQFISGGVDEREHFKS